MGLLSADLTTLVLRRDNKRTSGYAMLPICVSGDRGDDGGQNGKAVLWLLKKIPTGFPVFNTTFPQTPLETRNPA